MIVFYTSLLTSLAVVHWLVTRRAARLEHKFGEAAEAADRVLTQPVSQAGTGGVGELCCLAKQQYQLGYLLQRRDVLEARHARWQHLAGKLARAVEVIRGWKGRKLPYTMGVMDVAGAMYLVDRYGLNPSSLQQIQEWVSSVIVR